MNIEPEKQCLIFDLSAYTLSKFIVKGLKKNNRTKDREKEKKSGFKVKRKRENQRGEYRKYLHESIELFS